MREIKSELMDAEEHNVVVLQNIPQHQWLIKNNRFLLIVVSSLMAIVLLLGFLLVPSNDILDHLKVKQGVAISTVYAVQNPVLSSEINILKSQLVGLVSGSIESKLRILEESIREGRIATSLGTLQDLKNDVNVLRSYSEPKKKQVKVPASEEVLKQVSQLKDLIYLTLSSCALIIAAFGGIWAKNRYQLAHQTTHQRATLNKQK